jgi:glycosyltransferase involved in cell wall biosynthesis
MQENKAMISVIVPAYNAEATVRQTLESVASQTYANWECIIVDDGSKDNTSGVVREFIGNDQRFKLITIANSGVCVARNTAVSNSKGKYLFPLDSDNYIHPTCFEKCMHVFEKNPNVRLVYTESELFGVRTGLWNLPEYSYKTMLRYNMVDNSSLFLREDFDRVGGYRVNMVNGLEDWDFWIGVLAPYKDDQVVKIKEPLFYYRTSDQSRGATVVSQGKFALMLDNIVYNNYSVYRQYFPDIFTRIMKHDFNENMMAKKPVKLLVNSMVFISSLKSKIFGK